MTHKLLLADDSVTIQRVIELTFADEDIEVTTVGDGQLAVERLKNNPPDIILADVDMPKRDGYEVAAYVKSRPKLAHIPVVLLTGAFEPIDQARATAAGSTDVLAKPFEPQMVINRVKELLGKKRKDEPDEYDVPAAPAFSPSQAPSLASPPTPPGRQAAADGEAAVSLDDYFDQLDAAFSTLQAGSTAAQDGKDDMDWIAVAPPASPLNLGGVAAKQATIAPPRPVAAMPPAPAPFLEPLYEQAVDSTAPPAPEATAASASAPWGASADKPVASSPVAPVAPIAPIAPIAPAAPVAAPRTTTNPFANLSAAKAAARPTAPVITDEIIEEVVTRVLQRMSDKVVRETVTAIVSETAERLVQEEIERIKDPGPE